MAALRVKNIHSLARYQLAQAQDRPWAELGNRGIDVHHLDPARPGTLGELRLWPQGEDRSSAAPREPLTHPENLALPSAPGGTEIHVDHRERPTRRNRFDAQLSPVALALPLR